MTEVAAVSRTEVIEGRRFRQALGHFCTGVTVITATEGGNPVGFACQSFSSLSLDPPLVLFCPSRTSGTWQVIRRAGAFCVNVLAHSQRDLSAVFGSRGGDKFADTTWRPFPSGAPVIDGALTWIDCDIEAVHAAGDHYLVIGRVRALGDQSDERPLLFYRGGYVGIAEESRDVRLEPVTDADETFFTWPRPDDWL